MASGAVVNASNNNNRANNSASITKITIAIIAAASSIATAGITAYFTADAKVQEQARTIERNQQQTFDKIDRVSGATAGSLAEGQKLCRVLQAHSWRDGVIVPKDWTVSLCQDYQKKTGGTGYQLGCIYSDGTTLGGENGTFPSPNCGWK